MLDAGYEIPEFWFERLDGRFSLPTWAGAIIFGAGPFGLLLVVASPFVISTPEELFVFVVLGLVISSAISLFTFYTGRYLRREITNLLTYARVVLDASTEGGSRVDLSNLTSMRWIGVTYAFLLAFAIPLFALGVGGGLLTNLLGEIPYLWFNLILASFIWAFGYSNYSINKMGKLPLKLKPYTQDRTLGLKPFATASLNSTLIYFSVSTTLVLVVVLAQQIPFEFALLFLWLYPLGLLIFLLPQRSLHAKLVEEKAKKLAWLEPRATALLKKLESEPSIQIDQDIANELTAIDRIQRNIQQIRAWPFDTGILTRLAAVLLSVTAILISAYLRNVLSI